MELCFRGVVTEGGLTHRYGWGLFTIGVTTWYLVRRVFFFFALSKRNHRASHTVLCVSVYRQCLPISEGCLTGPETKSCLCAFMCVMHEYTCVYLLVFTSTSQIPISFQSPPCSPIHFCISLQKMAGIPWISARSGIRSFIETRHLFSY